MSQAALARQMDAFLSPSQAAIDIRDSFNPRDWVNIYEFAFWASDEGGSQAGLQAGYDRLNPLVAEIQSATAGMGSYEKAQYVQHFMHKNLLSRYIEKQTLITVLLREGSYNCVSSAVLYSILATAAGLDVQGVQTADHAFCVVSTERGPIDNETTNYYGFDPGTQTEFKSQFGSTTGYAYVQPGNYRDRQQIDLRHLVALILYNRMAESSSNQNWGVLAACAINRWYAQGCSRDGRDYDDLVSALLNVGSELIAEKDPSAALLWSDRCIAAYGPSPRWDDFRKIAIQNFMAQAINSGNIQSAKDFLSAHSAELSRSDALDYSIQIEISRIEKTEFQAHNWKAAWQDADAAITRYGQDPRLVQLRSAARNNCFASVYNAAAAAYNKKDFSEAKRLAESGLAEFPGDSRLAQLLNYANSALAGGD